MTDEPAKKKLLTVPQLRECGWTDAMVRDLLGDPDELRRNPVYRSAAPMRLYAPDRVSAAEEDPAFAKRKSQAARRSAASAEAAWGKREELLAAAAAVPVTVPVLDREALIRAACASYNAWNFGREDYIRAAPDSDPLFVERIVVNYLRHELTSYEAELGRLFGKVGRADATSVIRERVYGAIADAYPELAAECDRQVSRRAT
jgi:hypothetical protein